LRGEYESVNADVHGLRVENNGINDAIHGRNADINRLKAEIADVTDENRALDNEKRDSTNHL